MVTGNTLSDNESQAKMIIAKALDGNDIAVKAVKRVAKYLGIGISNIVNVLGIKSIVVLSNYTHAWHLVKPEMEKELHRRIIALDPNELIVTPLDMTEQHALIAAESLGAKDIFAGKIDSWPEQKDPTYLQGVMN
jgi:predicted NBD/HSP70 family sugar kinase